MAPPANENPVPVVDKAGVRAVVASQKARGRLKRLKRAPVARVPVHIEAKYLLGLRKLLGALERRIRARVIPQIPRIIAQAPAELRRDAEDLEIGREMPRFDEFDKDLARLADQVRIEFLINIKPRLSELARAIAQDVEVAQQRDHRRAFVAVLGVDPEAQEPWLKAVTDNFVRTNVKLIENLSQTVMDNVERRVGDGVRQGLTATKIGEQIEQDSAASGNSLGSNRAKLIARDQVGSLYSDVAKVRMKNLGIRRYRWRNSQDERVRPSHQEREGEIFVLDDPIEPQLEEKGLTVDKIDGHAGRPPLCRCIQEPIFEDILEDAPEVGDDDEDDEPPESPPGPRVEVAEEEEPAPVPSAESDTLNEAESRANIERKLRLGTVVEDLSSESRTTPIGNRIAVRISELAPKERQVVDAVTLFTRGNVASVRDPTRFDAALAAEPIEGPLFKGEGKSRRGVRFSIKPGRADYEAANRVIADLASRPLTTKKAVFRGMRLPDEIAEAITIGAVFDIGSMSSWSEDLAIARRFAVAPGGAGIGSGARVIFEMVPTRGTSIRKISYFPHEQEFISSGKCRVLSVEQDEQGTVRVRIEQDDSER